MDKTTSAHHVQRHTNTLRPLHFAPWLYFPSSRLPLFSRLSISHHPVNSVYLTSNNHSFVPRGCIVCLTSLVRSACCAVRGRLVPHLPVGSTSLHNSSIFDTRVVWRQGIRHNFDAGCIAAPASGSVTAPSRARECMQEVDSSWNVVADGDAREGKWRENWWMQWVANTLHTISEHGVSNISTDAHTSAAGSRLNWRPSADLNGLARFARKTKYGFCACDITFQLVPNTDYIRAVPEAEFYRSNVTTGVSLQNSSIPYSVLRHVHRFSKASSPSSAIQCFLSQIPIWPSLTSSSSCLRLLPHSRHFLPPTYISPNNAFQKAVPTQDLTKPVSLPSFYCM